MQKKRYLVFEKDFVWLEQTALGWQLPNNATLLPYIDLANEQSLCVFNEQLLCAVDFSDTLNVPSSLMRHHLRACVHLLTPELFNVLAKAKQLREWQQTHRFCGRCGFNTISADAGKARACPACQLVAYPRISPCIMVAVYRGHELLLARSAHFRPDLYSVLAGFIEVGESAEECAHREAYEEVGIRMGQLQYFGSQPWPFPHQLMLAYSAPYLSGDVRCDPSEIEAAHWFTVENLPLLPEAHTLSRQLLQHVIDTKLTSF